MCISFRIIIFVSIVAFGLTASATPTLQEVKKQYFSIKREIAKYDAIEQKRATRGEADVDAENADKQRAKSWIDEDSGLPVFECQSGTEKFFGAGRFEAGEKPEPFNTAYYRALKYPFDTLTGDLFDLAYDILTAKKFLKEEGYPNDVWENLLIDGEEQTIREAYRRTISKPRWEYEGIRQRYKNILVKNLNDFAQTHKDKYFHVVEVEGCGAGESNFKIITDPPGISVEIMPQMLAKLCMAQKKDLMTGDNCPYWRRLDPPANVLLSGTYRIRLASASGENSLRVIDFDKLVNKEVLKIKQ